MKRICKHARMCRYDYFTHEAEEGYDYFTHEAGEGYDEYDSYLDESQPMDGGSGFVVRGAYDSTYESWASSATALMGSLRGGESSGGGAVAGEQRLPSSRRLRAAA